MKIPLSKSFIPVLNFKLSVRKLFFMTNLDLLLQFKPITLLLFSLWICIIITTLISAATF